MFGYLFKVEVDAETGGVAEGDVAVSLSGQAGADGEVPGGVELGVVLLDLEVDDGCVEVHLGDGADG